MLTTYLVLLLVIPSDRGIGPLGAAGSPSTLFGLGMLLWWVWHHLRTPRTPGLHRSQPVRIALYVFVLSVLASYVVSTLSVLPFVDSNASNMQLLSVASYAGVVLVGVDGLRDRERFLAVLRRIAFLGGCYAVLGFAQFMTGHNFVDMVPIPGLSSGGAEGIDTRGGFVRPEATARHTLEYAAVLSMILPLALTLGISDRALMRLKRWFPAVAILMAALVSVTRSALLGVVASLVLLVPTWKRSFRIRAMWVGGLGLVAMYFLVPGLAGTLLGMFSGGDPSVASRTDSYAVVGSYLSISPWFGRGAGTLGPSYRIFDNQYIGLLIETGIIGLAAFLGVVLTAIVTTLFRRRHGTDPVLDALGPALAGAVLAGALLCAFFDAFHFPQAVGMLFLAIGLCGAHWNLQSPEEMVQGPGRTTGGDGRGVRRAGAIMRRRWYVATVVLLLAIPATVLAWSVPGVYYAEFDLHFVAPAGATKHNPLRTEPSSVVKYAALVERMYVSEHPNAPILPTRAPLYGTGLRDAQAVYLPNAGGQWQTNFNRPTVTVEIVKQNRDDVMAAAEEITKGISAIAIENQKELGVWSKSQITVQPDAVGVAYLSARGKYAVVGAGLLALGLSVGAAFLFDTIAAHARARLHRIHKGRRSSRQVRVPGSKASG
ncbi:O-antigen ligase family protein [Arthrobacter sp. AETb3-4]|uniref:O-antigen ligase family protein n=1 Tax=Arthrobacter wenxiniae TaxID=2713570 RepID=A0A7Y7IFA2_9MICC|nr:O-antigen ligase family protein [Arthrobacter wenxiniae]